MAKLILRSMILVCFAAFFAGCIHRPAAKTLLTPDQAKAIAVRAAGSEGIDTAKYDLTGCYYEYTRKDGNWTVFFTLKPPTPPGGHFMVWVNDKTGKTRLVRGE